MKKALIFDLDGVIIISENSRFGIFQKVLESKGIYMQDNQMHKYMGKTTRDILDMILTKNQEVLREDIINEYNSIYKTNVMSYVRPVDMVVEFLLQYKGSLKLAVASNSQIKLIETVLSALNLSNKIPVITSRDEVKAHKPNPEIYVKTAKKLDFKPEECIAFEDSITGATSAINANMDCYVVLNGYNSRQEFEGMNIKGFISSKEDLERLIA